MMIFNRQIHDLIIRHFAQKFWSMKKSHSGKERVISRTFVALDFPANYFVDLGTEYGLWVKTIYPGLCLLSGSGDESRACCVLGKHGITELSLAVKLCVIIFTFSFGHEYWHTLNFKWSLSNIFKHLRTQLNRIAGNEKKILFGEFHFSFLSKLIICPHNIIMLHSFSKKASDLYEILDPEKCNSLIFRLLLTIQKQML